MLARLRASTESQKFATAQLALGLLKSLTKLAEAHFE
jgi:hypothetical protein